MKIRKTAVFALTALATSLGLVGFTLASVDDETPVHKAMEKVQLKDSFIKKNLKSEEVFKKNQKEIVASAKELATLCKSVRDDPGPAKDQKKTQKEWSDFIDACVKDLETFATDVAKSDITQKDAKAKYNTAGKSCTACHEVFRKED